MYSIKLYIVYRFAQSVWFEYIDSSRAGAVTLLQQLCRMAGVAVLSWPPASPVALFESHFHINVGTDPDRTGLPVVFIHMEICFISEIILIYKFACMRYILWRSFCRIFLSFQNIFLNEAEIHVCDLTISRTPPPNLQTAPWLLKMVSRKLPTATLLSSNNSSAQMAGPWSKASSSDSSSSTSSLASSVVVNHQRRLRDLMALPCPAGHDRLPQTCSRKEPVSISTSTSATAIASPISTIQRRCFGRRPASSTVTGNLAKTATVCIPSSRRSARRHGCCRTLPCTCTCICSSCGAESRLTPPADFTPRSTPFTAAKVRVNAAIKKKENVLMHFIQGYCVRNSFATHSSEEGNTV